MMALFGRKPHGVTMTKVTFTRSCGFTVNGERVDRSDEERFDRAYDEALAMYRPHLKRHREDETQP